MQTAITILYIVFLILALGDIITTIKLLDIPGGYEKNKFMARLMDKIGVIPALASTNFIAAVLLGALTYFYPGDFIGVLLAMADIYGGYLVWNNWQILRRA